MAKYKIIDKSEFLDVAPLLFGIFHSNMNSIVSACNGDESDCRKWIENLYKNLNNPARKIILISIDETIVGFFMYSISEDIFRMEEVQLLSCWQKRHNIFRELFGFIFSMLPKDIRKLESCANKENIKSQEIQKHIGLKLISQDEKYCYFQGAYSDLYKWYLRGNHATHNMRLHPEPFEKIKSGAKRIEIRLNDEKRKQISVGDSIVFSCGADQIVVDVVGLRLFASFKELFEKFPDGDLEKRLDDTYKNYYSVEQEQKYGVLGIEIQVKEV